MFQISTSKPLNYRLFRQGVIMFDFRSTEKIIRDIKLTEYNHDDSKLIIIRADSKDKLVGELKAVISEEKALLGDIDIPDKFVNYGIGSRLLMRFEEICSERFVKEIVGNLATVDLDHKERLIHFYEKHHYQITYEEDGNYWGKIVKKL